MHNFLFYFVGYNTLVHKIIIVAILAMLGMERLKFSK